MKGHTQMIKRLRDTKTMSAGVMDGMKVITLCGSTRFKKQFEEVNADLTRQGNVVISLAFFEKSEGMDITEEEAAIFEKVHFHKIDLANEIFVIDVDRYIGSSTRTEIQYAEQHGKAVRYYSNEYQSVRSAQRSQSIQLVQSTRLKPSTHPLQSGHSSNSTQTDAISLCIEFKPMDKEHAIAITHWEYPDPYCMYNMDQNEEAISELLNGEYFRAENEQGELIGYCCHGTSARVPGGYQAGVYENNASLDIGFGLRPYLTGHQLGYPYHCEVIDYLYKKYAVQQFRLVVASFNKRAINVYKRAGFQTTASFKSKVNDKEIDFIAMELDKG
jgi:[ribosomal protein S18]-alanine N-acetyltransferase